ncbi:uncharacterized protein LOC118185233 [Stegodyphus dumicola]|uniref:uncharacterized protein LOC118185233 n=1 Tax=Stegodyphus dumicola TaxID=202533 RepID=UPI0015B34B3E|nr:uncharacterized protein LOC118185233 [Stegodyphus dumicola]
MPICCFYAGRFLADHVFIDEYTISNCEVDADDLKRANLGNGSKEMNEIIHEQQEPNLDFVTQIKATDSPSQASGSQKGKMYSPMVETKADKSSKIMPTPKLLRKAKRQPPASNAAAAALVEHSELKSKFLSEEHELTMKLKKEEHEST